MGQPALARQHPPGTAIRFQTRSGNTETPDDTWSGWSGQLRDGDGETVPSPPARFIQWRSRLLGSASGSPALEGVWLHYLERNLPPRLHAIEVVTAGEGLLPVDYESGPDRVEQTLPSGVVVEFAFPGSPTRPVRLDEVGWVRSTKISTWVAEDPNDDQLEFDLYIKGEEETDWKPLAEEIAEQIYAFETRNLEDGHYRVRVVAGDGASNPEGNALTDALESRTFLVDNTAPEIHALRAQRQPEGTLLVTAEVVDLRSVIASFELSLDGGDWKPAFPEDAIYDAREESFRVRVPTDAPESEHTVLVRAADAAGNSVARRAVVP